MNAGMRIWLAVSLALMLSLTSQAMAVMRGTPGPAGEIVLCTGSGPISVQVDENGQPVGKPHICPDCALSLFALDAGLPGLPERFLGRGARLGIVETAQGVSIGAVRAVARGPPGAPA